MAASSAAGVVDPTKLAEYPVILSDALLGRPSTETFTGVRYNHKPTLSSETAPNTARLKPSNGSNGPFELSFQDNGDKYAYSGTRSKDGQYVLIFDPARKAFVLHRADSVFNMNMTRTPANTDADSLKEQYPHLESSIKVQVASQKTQEKGKAPSRATKAKDTAASKSTSAAKKKAEKTDKSSKAAKASAPVQLSLPPAPPPEPEPRKQSPPPPKKKKPRPVESEEEDDSGDGGLVIEFPGQGGNSVRGGNDFSPAFPPPPAVQIRRFSEFAREQDNEDDDADAEDDFDAIFEEDEGHIGDFKLGSPLNNSNTAGPSATNATQAAHHQGAAQDDEFDDIEAEFEAELLEESEVSEED